MYNCIIYSFLTKFLLEVLSKYSNQYILLQRTQIQFPGPMSGRLQLPVTSSPWIQ